MLKMCFEFHLLMELTLFWRYFEHWLIGLLNLFVNFGHIFSAHNTTNAWFETLVHSGKAGGWHHKSNVWHGLITVNTTSCKHINAPLVVLAPAFPHSHNSHCTKSLHVNKWDNSARSDVKHRVTMLRSQPAPAKNSVFPVYMSVLQTEIRNVFILQDVFQKLTFQWP